MQGIMEFLKTDNYLLILSVITLSLFISFIFLFINYGRLNNKYKKFMNKLGNGKNLEEDLENFMYKVDRVEKQNAEITNYCRNWNS